MGKTFWVCCCVWVWDQCDLKHHILVHLCWLYASCIFHRKVKWLLLSQYFSNHLATLFNYVFFPYICLFLCQIKQFVLFCGGNFTLTLTYFYETWHCSLCSHGTVCQVLGQWIQRYVPPPPLFYFILGFFGGAEIGRSASFQLHPSHERSGQISQSWCRRKINLIGIPNFSLHFFTWAFEGQLNLQIDIGDDVEMTFSEIKYPTCYLKQVKVSVS